MTNVKSMTFTSVLLWVISAIGGLLVGEQIITGEQLTDIQGIIGLALAGGGVTASAVLYALKVIVPTMIVKLLLRNVKDTNPETYDKLVATFKNPQEVIALIADISNGITRILELEEARTQALNELTNSE